MKHLDGIEVKIRLRGQDEHLKEYVNQSPGLKRGWSHWISSNLVSAPAGQDFEISLIIRPKFKMFSAKALTVTIQPYGSPVHQAWAISADEKGLAGEYTFSAMTHWNGKDSLPTSTAFKLPKPDASSSWPLLKNTWHFKDEDEDDGVGIIPNPGCIAFSLERVNFVNRELMVVSGEKYCPPQIPLLVPARVPIIIDDDWVKILNSCNGMILVGEFRNIARENIECELVIATETIPDEDDSYDDFDDEEKEKEEAEAEDSDKDEVSEYGETDDESVDSVADPEETATGQKAGSDHHRSPVLRSSKQRGSITPPPQQSGHTCSTLCLPRGLQTKSTSSIDQSKGLSCGDDDQDDEESDPTKVKKEREPEKVNINIGDTTEAFNSTPKTPADTRREGSGTKAKRSASQPDMDEGSGPRSTADIQAKKRAKLMVAMEKAEIREERVEIREEKLRIREQLMQLDDGDYS